MEKIISTITSTLEQLHLKPGDSSMHLKPPAPEEVAVVRQKYKEQAQSHVFAYWDTLSPEQQAQLYNQLLNIDPARLSAIIEEVLSPNKDPKSAIGTDLSPVPSEHVASTLEASPETLKEWREKGLRAISEGKVAVLLMAGGQGTRLGSSQPKGCYNIGLPSGKSLLQLQAERLVRLHELAAEEFGNQGDGCVIPWYIMTSGPTRKDTEEFLRSHKYFGLKVYRMV